MSQDQHRDTETMAERAQRMEYASIGDFALSLERLDPNLKIKSIDGDVTISFSDGSSFRASRNPIPQLNPLTIGERNHD